VITKNVKYFFIKNEYITTHNIKIEYGLRNAIFFSSVVVKCAIEISIKRGVPYE